MDARFFSASHKSFRLRLFDHLTTPLLMVVILGIIFSYLQQPFSIVFIAFLLLIILLGFGAYQNAKDFISEIQFLNGEVVIKGETGGNKWIKSNAVSNFETKVKVEIRSLRHHTYLQLKINGNTYYLNKYLEWRLEDLAEIYRLVQQAKHGRLTLDDQFMIENIAQKSFLKEGL